MDDLLWLLLPIAAASGWAFAKREDTPDAGKAPDLSSDYFKGLNYLLNEQTDKAIECFVRMLEVDSDTVEIHLAVGNLFRQRGEVDRAIRIHGNLITRPRLSKSQRAYALLELAQDYMRAGLFDRAESLCQELIALETHTERALTLLSDIYQQEKEWEQAITVTRRLQDKTGKSGKQAIAQFQCELAEQARDGGDGAEAQRRIESALATDPACVRASMLRGELACAAGDYKGAIHAYRQVERQDPAYLPEVIPALVHCYGQQGNMDELVDYLHKAYEERGGVTVLLAVTDVIEQQRGKDAALSYLVQHLHDNPSLRGVVRLMEMEEEGRDPGVREMLELLKDTVERVLEEKPVYQCTHCGFAGKALHWHCPGCKRWGTVKPILGLEGE
ncbi:MAG: lipopolysaccharide assembly protein LapB [Gammaproteobacteria bacterium]|jgi:lipopolysaccharide biosynthesis regulator YciM